MKEIERIIADYLENGTQETLAKAIEQYILKAREQSAILALGWSHADNCVDVDKGKDIRKKIIPEMMDRMMIDLSAELKKGLNERKTG